MKRNEARFFRFVLAFAVLLGFTRAIVHLEMLKEQQSVLRFAVSGQQEGVDYISARTAQEENQSREKPLEFVNWTQVDGTQVSAVELGSMEEGSSIVLCGRSDLLFPGYAVLDMEMQEYCLISSALSEKLFGGNDTAGLLVETQERKLEVLDVIDSEEAFLVFEAVEMESCLFDRAAVRCVSGKSSKTAEEFQQLCGPWEQMDGRILVWIAQAGCFLIPFILWILLLRRVWANAREMDGVRIIEFSTDDLTRGENDSGRFPVNRTYAEEEKAARAEKRIWRGIFYLLLVGGIGLLVSKIQIPEDMIPAKWSDFDFWLEYGKKTERAFWILVETEKKIPDMAVVREFAKTVWWGTVTGGIAALLAGCCAAGRTAP